MRHQPRGMRMPQFLASPRSRSLPVPFYVPFLLASRGLRSKTSTPCIFPRISRRSRPVACSRSVGMVPGAAPLSGRRSCSPVISAVGVALAGGTLSRGSSRGARYRQFSRSYLRISRRQSSSTVGEVRTLKRLHLLGVLAGLRVAVGALNCLYVSPTPSNKTGTLQYPSPRAIL